MGADSKPMLKTFGEILIDIKANKKSKVYAFKCAFCSINCDQLKKFSLHLDENHSKQFLEELKCDTANPEADNKTDIELIEPEVKVEQLMAIEDSSVDKNFRIKNLITTKRKVVHKDPLDMRESLTKRVKTRKTPAKPENIQKENDGDLSDAGVNACDYNSNEMDYEGSSDGTTSEDDDSDMEETLAEMKTKWNRKPKKVFASDVSSDDSKDADFDIDKQTGRVKRVHVKKSKKFTEVQMEEYLKVDTKQLVKELLKAFENQPILWKVKDRSYNRVIRQNGFEAIAQEVNEKLKIQMKWEDARNRIENIRDVYSQVYAKQMRGEQCEMPWYADHMKFLEENIKYLIQQRYWRRNYKRLKTSDKSHISLYIKHFKNCETLWKINNIGFFVKPKRVEALELIVKDIKAKDDIDINIHDLKRRLDYLKRIYSTDKERQLKCELNKTEFVPSSKLYADLSFLSESQGPFKCSHCNKIIHNFETYHQHVTEHTNSAPFKCGACEMHFTKLRTYIVHAKRHLGINNFHCDFCGKGYPVRAELEWHVREHTGEEPYLCAICGASFRSRHGYDNHIRRHENRFRYNCHICKRGFNHLHMLNEHVKVHLNIRDILCNVCGKGFTARRHLLHHQLIHSDKKRYKCDVCDKAFSQPSGLRAHRKQHIE